MQQTYGLDFGTSNSSIAIARGTEIDVLPVDPSAANPAVLSSVLYVDHAGRSSIGADAIRQFVEENRGREIVRQVRNHPSVMLWCGGNEFDPDDAGSKAVEWPVAALLYPVAGLLCGQLWRFYPEARTLFLFSLALPTLSLCLSIWVGGVSTHAALQDLLPCFPHAVDLRRTGCTERLLGTFRCHRYWLLASRAQSSAL